MNEKEMRATIKRIGSLRDMDQAVRMVERFGFTVVAVDGLTITALGHVVVEFKSAANGRVVIK